MTNPLEEMSILSISSAYSYCLKEGKKIFQDLSSFLFLDIALKNTQPLEEIQTILIYPQNRHVDFLDTIKKISYSVESAPCILG